MQGNIKLSVDIMSGDIHPRSCFCACLSFVKKYPEAHLTLVGDADIWHTFNTAHPALSFVESLDVISTHDALRDVLRKKHASSMYKAVSLLSNNDVHACVSAGSTAAMLAIGNKLLKKAPQVTRPAIARAMPTVHGSYIMLDLGATVDCTPEQLLEFALMGSAIAKPLQAHQPKVALLSNGHEPVKGNKVLRKAQVLLENCDAINYVGFIEGDALFNTDVDVVVCDGFVGNVALKVSEGAVRFVTQGLHSHDQTSCLARLKAFLINKLHKAWQQQHNPDNYNGAIFIGFDTVLIKSHGGASQAGFLRALEFAYQQVEQNTPAILMQYFTRLYPSSNIQN